VVDCGGLLVWWIADELLVDLVDMWWIVVDCWWMSGGLLVDCWWMSDRLVVDWW